MLTNIRGKDRKSASKITSTITKCVSAIFNRKAIERFYDHLSHNY